MLLIFFLFVCFFQLFVTSMKGFTLVDCFCQIYQIAEKTPPLYKQLTGSHMM